MVWPRFRSKQTVTLLGQKEILLVQTWYFTADVRGKYLNQEILETTKEAQVVIGQWCKLCNTTRPHSSLNDGPPASQAFDPLAVHLDEIAPTQ
jgi:putative transposase